MSVDVDWTSCRAQRRSTWGLPSRSCRRGLSPQDRSGSERGWSQLAYRVDAELRSVRDAKAPGRRASGAGTPSGAGCGAAVEPPHGVTLPVRNDMDADGLPRLGQARILVATKASSARDASHRCGARERQTPAERGFLACAEENSNLHPVIPDQALNPILGFAMLPFRSTACVASFAEEPVDGMDGLDVATTPSLGPA